ncbi:MAG TPA: HD domain-containing phosphohydrolase [Thermoanaerobaculia bacterium]|nr:HD domain-containing phosphohydrolase [Thermoanaerobaculia bacterium]
MLDPTVEQRYREALFSLLEKSKTTRSALYMMEPTGEFRLVTQYGFSPRDLPIAQFGKEHPLIEWVNRFRKPFYFNSPVEAQSLRREMEASHTARLLAAPLYEDGRLVGIIEGRDKAGGDLYYPEDARAIAAVAGEILRIRRQTLGGPEPAREPTEEMPGFFEMPTASAASAPAVAELPRPKIRRVTNPPSRPPITQREALLFRGFASTLLLDPEIAGVVFSLWAGSAAEFYIGSRRPIGSEARESLVGSAEEVFTRLFPGRAVPSERRFNVDFPHGRTEGDLARDEIRALQTSALLSEEGRAILFSLIFTTEPLPERAPAIREIHLLVRRSVTETREAARYRDAYRGLIRRLLDPGLKKYSGLVTHSLSVARIARRFAGFLRLAEATIEQITVAAMLHDVGLRELSYDRISEKRPLTEAEYRLARDHPSVGAMLLAEIEFPYAIIPLVLHHHERYDGSGYPDQLRGEQIPFGARLIHIVEAFDAMTAPTSYRPTISRDEAVETIESKGGTQFDPNLAAKFRDFVAGGGLDKS